MKKFGKRLSFLLAILVLISFALPTALLAEQETTIVIHKLVMTQSDLGAFEGFTDYNGTAIEPKDYGANVKEVSGVAFRLYKEADDQTEGALLGSQIPYEGLTVSNYYLPVTEGAVNGVYLTGADNAGATISNLANGTYVIVEDKVASTYEYDGALPADSKAIPATITLPYTLPDGSGYFDNNNPLHLYPKNTEEKPDITKTFGDELTGVPSLTIGDSVPYIVTTTIDKGATYKTLTWTDTMANGLTYDNDLVIKLGETVMSVDTDYTLTSSDTGFALSLTEQGLTKVATAVDSNQVTITLNYSATLNSNALVEDLQSNTIKLTYGNSTETTYDIETDDISVTTYGRKFVKVDSTDSTKPLAGAEFKVMNEDQNKYLKAIVDDDGAFLNWEWVNVDAATDAYILTSATESDTTEIIELGTFEITGLAEGDYFLVETKAPEGYALPTDPYVAFSVAEGSYEGEGTVALSITNTALSIPQTGGTGTVIFFVSGVAIMALALVGMKLKKSKDAE